MEVGIGNLPPNSCVHTRTRTRARERTGTHTHARTPHTHIHPCPVAHQDTHIQTCESKSQSDRTPSVLFRKCPCLYAPNQGRFISPRNAARGSWSISLPSSKCVCAWACACVYASACTRAHGRVSIFLCGLFSPHILSYQIRASPPELRGVQPEPNRTAPASSVFDEDFDRKRYTLARAHQHERVLEAAQLAGLPDGGRPVCSASPEDVSC